MQAKTLTRAVVGLEGALVEVAVDIGPGLPASNIVDLADAAVRGAKECGSQGARPSHGQELGRGFPSDASPPTSLL